MPHHILFITLKNSETSAPKDHMQSQQTGHVRKISFQLRVELQRGLGSTTSLGILRSPKEIKHLSSISSSIFMCFIFICLFHFGSRFLPPGGDPWIAKVATHTPIRRVSTHIDLPAFRIHLDLRGEAVYIKVAQTASMVIIVGNVHIAML